MSGPPPPNAWQSTSRPRPSQSASRTPQTRSGTASPNPQSQANQSPRQDATRSQQQQQTNNAWGPRGNTGGSNGQPRAESPVNGFNATEVSAALAREQGAAVYKILEAPGGGRGNGAAWGARPNHMANNQPFFVQLAKQIATLEGGG
ncbi:hypothetical protein LTR53_000330 [Teratosphaeriaceae sp. CCFEE 6253]|nr:hypothetical protein LTR53_000330 [Teratosphaeriaceae sp. CCFEE 6253]